MLSEHKIMSFTSFTGWPEMISYQIKYCGFYKDNNKEIHNVRSILLVACRGLLKEIIGVKGPTGVFGKSGCCGCCGLFGTINRK